MNATSPFIGTTTSRPVLSIATLMAILFVAGLWGGNLQSHAQNAAGQEAPLTCVVCGKSPLSGKVGVHNHGHVCENCLEIKTRCAHCGIPVKDGFTKTSDGRLFCRMDTPTLVFSTSETRQVFADASAALVKLSGGMMALRQPAVEVSLTDVDDWNANGTPAELRRKGFSKSRQVGQDFSHIVSLLSAQPRGDLRGTCAHEYTHLWINENKAEQRKIDSDTLEAICELSAYKLAQNDGDTNQMARILANPYTKGMITNLVAIEAQRGFDSVLDWVKGGVTERLDMDGINMTAPAPVIKTEFPDEITLTGLMGSASRRIAMVSGVMIKKGERRKIQLKDKALSVRCLEIHEDHVLVQVEGEKEPRKLAMKAR